MLKGCKKKFTELRGGRKPKIALEHGLVVRRRRHTGGGSEKRRGVAESAGGVIKGGPKGGTRRLSAWQVV